MSTPTIRYGHAYDEADLAQILALQNENLGSAISAAEAQEQGFVTVRHDLDLLRAMNEDGPHVVARHGADVVGYALVMALSFAAEIPVLRSLFDTIGEMEYQGRPLSTYHYFVMGQVCVAKSYRGMGVFDGLYGQMKADMAGRYDCIVTEIATRNLRSLRAHARVGFEVVNVHTADEGEEWAVVVLPL